MNCHGETSSSERDSPVVLVGNPNVGKSVIFGRLTGRYVTVANYPGTTVELASGTLPDGTPLIDTPGLNALSGDTDDQRVTRDLLASSRPRAIVQVADARNLPRALLLTLELVDLGLPLVLALNMTDEAEASGVRIDARRLASRLGIEVVPTVAIRGEGIDRLAEAARRATRPATCPAGAPPGTASGSLASEACEALPPEISAARDRWRAVGGLLDGVMTVAGEGGAGAGARFSRATTHPVVGWPILVAVLAAVYLFVGRFGAGTLVGAVEGTLFGKWINPAAARAVARVIPIALLRDLLVGEYGLLPMALTYGLAIVMPIVSTFFLAFSVLEDSGYLPRLAVMLNRAFRAIGLNGKAVLPMVLGLGCDTMATMTTRILDSRKHRIQVTLLLALGVPCSAQLGVILGMLGAMTLPGVAIWAGVVLATMLAVGLLAARLLPGEGGDFIVELPPLRRPALRNIAVKTAARLEWYLREVLPLFVAGTLILFVLDRTGALGAIERAGAPVIVRLLGLPAKATGAFLIGFLRRDYGAAGIFAMSPEMDPIQIVVSLIVITLFIPCIANIMVIVKEHGGRVAAAVAAVVFPLAFAVGGVTNLVLRGLSVRL
ncbi:MAG: ferrous iron transporter B [Acidobacteria bacterium]|nr:ferrous iron transporter B [Acidobacteriota bacterium]